VDGKILINPGVIPAGSLNSSAYDQSQHWSNNYTGNNGNAPTPAFNGLGPVVNGYAHNAAALTLNFSPALSGRIIVYGGKGGSTADDFTISDGTNTTTLSSDQTYASAPYWDELDFGEQTGITSLTCSAGYCLYGIRVDGKLLVDSNVTPPSVPFFSSTTRANPSAGFSIITLNFPSYSGTSSVAHGLNAAPDFWVMKDRDSADGWYLGHKSIGAGNYLRLESSGASAASTTIWDNRLPDSNFIYNNGTSMSTAGSYVMYAWASVEGYSAFGSYTGNASADGPFVYTGFRPKWVLIRCSSTTQNWVIIDAERNTYNIVNNGLYADLSNAEQTSNRADFTSNGFKIRTNSGELNTNSGTHIYAAFAEHPFKSARAR